MSEGISRMAPAGEGVQNCIIRVVGSLWSRFAAQGAGRTLRPYYAAPKEEPDGFWYPPVPCACAPIKRRWGHEGLARPGWRGGSAGWRAGRGRGSLESWSHDPIHAILVPAGGGCQF